MRGLLDGSEIGQGLLDLIIEDMEILAAQTLHELSRSISGDHPHIDTIYADADGGLLLLCVDCLRIVGLQIDQEQQQRCLPKKDRLHRPIRTTILLDASAVQEKTEALSRQVFLECGN